MKATPTGLVLSLSPECPHSLIQKSLEMFLRDVQSIPLLLQGMCATDNSMSVLAGFKEKMPPVMVSASAPSEVQLSYDNLYPFKLCPKNRVISYNMIYLNQYNAAPWASVSKQTLLLLSLVSQHCGCMHVSQSSTNHHNFVDIKYSKPVVPTLQTNPLHYLQVTS